MHAKWLAYGCPKGRCQCRYCSKTKQGDITRRLKKKTAFIRDWTIIKSSHTATHARTSPPAGNAPVRKVIAKDYTRINEGRIDIWVEE